MARTYTTLLLIMAVQKKKREGEKKEIERLNNLVSTEKITQFEEKFSFELARKNK